MGGAASALATSTSLGAERALLVQTYREWIVEMAVLEFHMSGGRKEDWTGRLEALERELDRAVGSILSSVDTKRSGRHGR